MPNWCMNNLTVTHSDPAELQKFCDAYNSGGVCNYFIPTPLDSNGAVIMERNDPNYWYAWNIKHWGVKWDFGKDEVDDPVVIENDQVSISFNTAWSPPIEFYGKLEKLGYGISATYWEPGIGFCGTYENKIEDTIEYENHDEIPDTLWDEFGMADFFEEMA